MVNLVKKFIAASAIVATAASVFPAFTATTAHAQVAAYNPISQWIVLSGLFNPYYGGAYGGGYGGGYGVPYYNPISQWIVLGSLFNPYMFGGAYGGTGVNNYGGSTSVPHHDNDRDVD